MTEEDFSKLINVLKEDLKFYNDMILEVSKDIMKEGFSEYPVFIATEHEIKIGNLILFKNDYARDFNIYATTLEELEQNSLIQGNRKEEFVKTYKDPKRNMCILLITSETASFVFTPYIRN